jgi:hypothetical protein
MPDDERKPEIKVIGVANLGSGTVCGELLDVGAALCRDFSVAAPFVGA